MPIVLQNAYAQASIAGADVGQILSARCTFGFDLRVSEAYIVCPAKPSSGTYWDTVQLFMGGTQQSAALRFSGVLLEYDFDLYPGACTLVCRGNLYRALIYENPQVGGTDMTLTGAGQTDQAMVTQVLSRVPSLSFSSARIGGTGKQLGTLAYSDIGPAGDFTGPFAWGGPSNFGQGVGETALNFIERLDAISEGYRTFETLAGNIYRFQIYGRPTNSSDYSFTEGVDIFAGRGVRTVIPTKNAALVTGYDYGTGIGPVFWLNLSGTFAAAGQQTVSFSSPMIEKYQEDDTQPGPTLPNGGTAGGTGLGPGTGQSCFAVSAYLLGEYDREVVKLQMTTYRDDLIGPGQTHSILSPTLGITEPLWVQRVDIELSPRGEFSQTMTYIGGGASPGATPPVQ